MGVFLSRHPWGPKQQQKLVVFLTNSQDENNLLLLYISNATKEAICLKKYNQPTRGGTFFRQPKLEKEQVLTDLVKCVYLTAKILQLVNDVNFLPSLVRLQKHQYPASSSHDNLCNNYSNMITVVSS